MSRFVGPQPGYKSNGNKGVMRAYKLRKRQEAQERQIKYLMKKIENSIDTQSGVMVESQSELVSKA